MPLSLQSTNSISHHTIDPEPVIDGLAQNASSVVKGGAHNLMPSDLTRVSCLTPFTEEVLQSEEPAVVITAAQITGNPVIGNLLHFLPLKDNATWATVSKAAHHDAQEIRNSPTFIFQNAAQLISMKEEVMNLYIGSAIRANPSFLPKLQAFAKVQKNGWALQSAHDELKADKDFVLAAVKKNGLALRFASDTLQADRDVVLAAVQRNGWALKFASEALRADTDVVLAVVKKNGCALRYASEALRADKNVVLAAVKKNGSVLQFASDTLQVDRDVVLAAVKQNGLALQFASDTLQADRDIVLAAFQDDDRQFKFDEEIEEAISVELESEHPFGDMVFTG